MKITWSCTKCGKTQRYPVIFPYRLFDDYTAGFSDAIYAYCEECDTRHVIGFHTYAENKEAHP